jgi:carbonic anhydrase
MKKLLLVASILLVAGAAYAGARPHWGYSGAKGPDHWGALSPEFSTCSAGKNQSPIDLTGFIEAELKPIGFHYGVGGKEILNNGHTVQVNYAPGSRISVDDREFELKQYHFHAPSENLINGKSYPMEAHLVHADDQGNLAVIAVMVVEGEANESLAQAWAHMPEQAGDRHSLSPNVAAEGILPSERAYYRYNGSLTTPPCSEGVRWFVMKEPVTASKAQIAQFTEVMPHPNNRPVRPLNARTILR